MPSMGLGFMLPKEPSSVSIKTIDVESYEGYGVSVLGFSGLGYFVALCFGVNPEARTAGRP